MRKIDFVIETVLTRLLRRALAERFGEPEDPARIAKDAGDDNEERLIYDVDAGGLDEAAGRRSLRETSDDDEPLDDRMIRKAETVPEMKADFEAAQDRDSLMKAKRRWMKALDNDEVPDAAKLYGLLGWLFDRQKQSIISSRGIEAFQRAPRSQEQQAKDARADRILRVRDSSGRARARKF